MNINNLHTVYFLGIGGIGMSAIARYFNAKGVQVGGYDKTSTALTDELQNEGITIHFTESVDQIPTSVKEQSAGTMVIYTPAIPSNNKEFVFLKEQGITLFKRSEVLGFISQNYFTIAIAGTHGKTTTSSIIAHVLNESGIKCNAFLGGISLNFNSNLLLNDSADVVIVEADEYDRSFLTLSPDIALITSLDADHLDVYGDKNSMDLAYNEFANKIKPDGKLISKASCIAALNLRSDIDSFTYSVDDGGQFSAEKVSIKDGYYVVDLNNDNEQVTGVKIGLPGIHNVENAIGAFAIARKMGVDSDAIKTALGSYKGVQRRFETHIKTSDLVYIDDYAHHPSELDMAIKSARALYPGKRITAIFQPHLYSRTRDFVDEFAKSLSALDELILLNIYPARELPIEGITSALISEKVSITNKSVISDDQLIEKLMEKDLEVLLTLGAGDIDTFIQPIKDRLSQREEIK